MAKDGSKDTGLVKEIQKGFIGRLIISKINGSEKSQEDFRE